MKDSAVSLHLTDLNFLIPNEAFPPIFQVRTLGLGGIYQLAQDPHPHVQSKPEIPHLSCCILSASPRFVLTEFPALLCDPPGKWKDELNVDVSIPCSMDSEIHTSLFHSQFSGVLSCSGPLPSLFFMLP